MDESNEDHDRTGDITMEIRESLEGANESNSLNNTGDTTRSIRRQNEISIESSNEHNSDAPTLEEYGHNVEVAMETQSSVLNNNDNVFYQVNEEENGSYSEYDIHNEYSYNNSVADFLYDSTDEESDIDDFGRENDAFGSRFKELLLLLQSEEYNNSINTTLSVNKAEILLSIMKYSMVYNLPHTAIADLCKMFNSFFNEQILPDTRYRVDKLFFPNDGIKYHAVCTKCGNYIKEFSKQDRFITCPICEERQFLKAANYNNFFVTLNVEDELKNLIEMNTEYYLKVMEDNTNVTENLRDFQSGRQYKEFVNTLPNEERNNYATLIFNSDGSPIFKSSKFSVWPIQISVNEIPFSVRYKNPITTSLWFGKDKPNMSIFLKAFVDQINQLSNSGIQCKLRNNTVTVKMYTLCCCVDTIARPTMQGFIQFNGYYGCSWCLHSGEMIQHNRGAVIKYPITNYVPIKRTEDNTLQYLEEAIQTKSVVYGVRMATPLLTIKSLNIIDGFVPDSMHCIALGVVKQFASLWFDVKNEPYSISNDNLKLIANYLKSFKVPSHLARLSRSVTERKYWKAREWENWLLYYSCTILHEIEGFDRYVNHWSLLVQGFYILMKDSISLEELVLADDYLKTFVRKTQTLYSKAAMTYNVHQLVHISQSVADWGPLWSHTGYSFESGNGNIVKTVHAAKGVLNQMCRNLTIKQSVNVLHQHILKKEGSLAADYCYYLDNRLTNKTERIGSHQYFSKRPLINSDIIRSYNLSLESIKSYQKLITRQNVFKSCSKVLLRSNNSFAILFSGEYIEIIQFLIDFSNDSEYTLYRKVVIDGNLNNVCSSIKKIHKIEEEIRLIETARISKLCVVMSVHNKLFISAVPTDNVYS